MWRWRIRCFRALPVLAAKPAGGNGGFIIQAVIRAADLGATEAVVIGSGGVGIFFSSAFVAGNGNDGDASSVAGLIALGGSGGRVELFVRFERDCSTTPSAVKIFLLFFGFPS